MSTIHLSVKKAQRRERTPFLLPLSKSIEARRLMLHAILGLETRIGCDAYSSLAEDIGALASALESYSHGATTIDTKESGTAMRLLTAYIAASTDRTITLTGQGRQYERPIAPLVDALRRLGADIDYLNTNGYPPLLIRAGQLRGQYIGLDASISSQYLSALLLIAPLVQGSGYIIDTSKYPIASRPYATMTLEIMKRYGFIWQERDGVFAYTPNTASHLEVARVVEIGQTIREADWTAASYAYLLLYLLREYEDVDSLGLQLPCLRLDSLQGDRQILVPLLEQFGIISEATKEGITLRLTKSIPIRDSSSPLSIDCSNAPDLVPTIVAILLAREQYFTITGVAHLALKESNRLVALQTEVNKLGYLLEMTTDTITYNRTRLGTSTPDQPIILDPHADHRMAMSLAPLMACKHKPGVIILDAHCVSKSFPEFWSELSKQGYTVENL